MKEARHNDHNDVSYSLEDIGYRDDTPEGILKTQGYTEDFIEWCERVVSYEQFCCLYESPKKLSELVEQYEKETREKAKI